VGDVTLRGHCFPRGGGWASERERSWAGTVAVEEGPLLVVERSHAIADCLGPPRRFKQP
jgi:hypothetical protein